MSKGIISFIIKDIKNDFILFFGFFTGKTKINKNKFKYVINELRNNYVEIFKDNYIFFLLMIAAFLCGMFISSKYWEMKANLAINSYISSQNIIPIFLNQSI